MASKIDSFKSDSGKVHESEHAAWIDDLDHWLGVSGIDNVPIRKAVIDAIKADIANGNHLVTIINNVKRTAPLPVAAYIPPPSVPGFPHESLPLDHITYHIPRADVPRARCTGIDCKHPLGTCTADPDYQRWIKAEKLYEASFEDGAAIIPMVNQSPSVQQLWLHTAELEI